MCVVLVCRVYSLLEIYSSANSNYTQFFIKHSSTVYQFNHHDNTLHLQGIGEGAIVLGQLLGYDNTAERMAVLDAGLAVRGVEFAHELLALTEEALEGFKAVMLENGEEGGNAVVDPELVKTVLEIDGRIKCFIGKKDNADFQ